MISLGLLYFDLYQERMGKKFLCQRLSANLKTRSIRPLNEEGRMNNVPTMHSPCNIDYYGILETDYLKCSLV